MMERIERKMKRLILASIGAAAVTREQSDGLMRELIARGEEVIDRSGIRNEGLRHDGAEAEAFPDAADRDAWLERLCEMSPEQLELLKDAIAAVERASREAEAEELREANVEPA